MNFFYALIAVIVFLASLAAALHALLTKTEPSMAIMWALVCLGIPVVGLVFYVLFGINRIRYHAKHHSFNLSNQDKTAISYKGEDIAQDMSMAASVGYSMTSRPLLSAQSITPLFNGEQAYPAMLQAIAKAEKTVWLTTYIFKYDKVGKEFIEALRIAKNRGVDVRILVDGIGIWRSRFRLPWAFKKAGLRFVRFNPPRLVPFQLFINLRNHRKILIVDGAVAFTGGMNIENENKKTRQDIHFEIRGSVLRELQTVFVQDWFYASYGERLKALPAPNNSKGRSLMRTIVSGPNFSENVLESILLGVFSCAKERIWLMTPYFLPTQNMISTLQSAALKGVDVVIVIPAKADHFFTRCALFRSIEPLLKYGIRLMFQPPPFNHAKLFIVDDFYSQIGSSNIDPRSLRLNFEMTLEVFDKNFTNVMAKYYQNVLRTSRRYTLAKLQSRPLWIRIRDSLCWTMNAEL